MKKRLLFCALLFAHAAFGQDAYFKSSIVTLRNDTIKGFVSNIYDSKSFKFKKKPSDKPTIYTPQQLKSVVLDGNTFESKAINVPYYKIGSIDGWGSTNASAVTGLVRNTEKGRLVDTVFIQKLVKGTVSLYKMTSLGGTTYYFAEKLGVFKEIPPLHYVLTTSSKGQKSEELQPSLSYGGGPFDLSLFVYKKREYLDTLAYFLTDKSFYTTKSTMKYSEDVLVAFIMQYNKKEGYTEGSGLLKNKVSRKIFWGGNAGSVRLDYDDIIENTKEINSFNFKLYGLYPLVGMDRHLSLKGAVNYFSYHNELYKKIIPSASFGMRYTGVDALIHPYAEFSIGVSGVVTNNKWDKNVDLPVILEAGVNIPVKDFFITLGINRAPVMNYKLNGYSFWAFHVGVMF